MSDILFDYTMDIIALAVAMRLGGHKISVIRIMRGAWVGMFASICMDMLNLTRIQSMFLWIPIACVMMLLATGDKQKPIRNGLILLCSEGLIGGLVVSFMNATGSSWIAYALGIIFALASAVSAMHSKQIQSDVSHACVFCTFHGRQAAFEAMIDSGNCLRDYLTHRPVIVLPEAAGRIQLDLNNRALRPIFAQTVGGRQMMWCFIPEETIILVQGKRMPVDAVVALSSGLQKDALALLPASLIRKE